MSAKPKTTVKAQVIDADMPTIVPASKTHKVMTREASALSAYEADLDRRQIELRGVEDELLQNSMEILSGALRFAEIPFDAETPTEEFLVRNSHVADPEKLFRIIKAAQMKTSEAPAGLMIAQKTAVGILKARAADKGKPVPLNVAVQVVTTMPSFEEMEVD